MVPLGESPPVAKLGECEPQGQRVACHSGELFEVSISQRLDPLGRDHDGRRSIHSALPNPANPAFSDTHRSKWARASLR